MDNLATIVFIGFDGYSDLWNDCIGLLKRFWPDCPYEVLFVNNTKEVSWPGIKVLHAGEEAEWSRKVQLALENCHTPYMCLLLEDFFVGANVNTQTVQAVVKIMKEHQLKYCKVTTSRPVKDKNPHFHNYSFLHVIPQDDDYGVSLQAAFWEVTYLKELLGNENYNAWKFEFARVKEAQGKPHQPALGCVFDERNILNLQHGVVQGKYFPNTIAYFKKRGIALNVQRPVMSYFEYYKRYLIGYGKAILPLSWRAPVKKLLEKCGMKFVSTVRNK